LSGARARAGDRARLTDREGFLAWAFLLPTIVYLTALVVAPLGLTVAFAFSRSTSDATSARCSATTSSGGRCSTRSP
jgi:multiple sugar transport system permease protein